MELLKQLYKIYAPTGGEFPIIEFIMEFLKEKVPGAQVELDRWGNMYITKGNDSDATGYPTLCCHLDQAQKIHSDDFEVRSRISEEGKEELNGWSEGRQAPEGLGADDKNGIWIALNALMEFEVIKVFMAIGEEKGCWGSNRANIEFFKDSRFILEPDCMGGKDIRTVLRGVPAASPDFEKDLEAEKFGYTVGEGKTTDILPLTISGVGVSCANLASGYYNRHKDDEYCIVEELTRCRDFVMHTIRNLKKTYPHIFITPTQQWVKNQYTGRMLGE